jgi:dipeptidyl-peptidase-4
MSVTTKTGLFLIGLLSACTSLSAQLKQLGPEQYFKNDFKGIIQPLPVVQYWIDGRYAVISRNGQSSVLDARTGEERPATDADKKPGENAAPKVYAKDDDLYIRSNGSEVRLTDDKQPRMNVTMSPDGNYAAYTKNNNLYTLHIPTKKETALTTDGSETILNGYASWVYTEEILGRASEYRAFWWSPDSRQIAYFRTDDSPVPVFTLTDAMGQHGYVETVRYPKVGDANPTVRIGFCSPEGGKTTWADFNEQYDQYFGTPQWTPDSKDLWVHWLNRGQDSLVIWAVDPASGGKREAYRETQKTWIQLDDGYDRLLFLKNNRQCLIASDETGWNHLYLHDRSGKRLNAITSGTFSVNEIKHVDEKNQVVYFTAGDRENRACYDLYRVNFNGKKMQRLSFGPYNHSSISLCPDGSAFITTYSNSATPPRMALVSNSGKIVRELGNAAGASFADYALAPTQMIGVQSEDGLYRLPMKVTWPVALDRTKKYPVLISIYGGPKAGTCWDSWQLSGNQQWYAQEGLIQVVMDHRGSGHFGKTGQNYLHRNLGYWEMKDYSTMVKWLVDSGYADPSRICITGFSYGGYLSCYALTYGAGTFTHAMAGGSVTDWRFYDTHYTERYMDTPAENPEGYKSSSVLTHVGKYKGNLQLVHGMIDDNVHVQNSLSLLSKLQDNKKEVECMFYSEGRHGWPGNKWLHYTNMKTAYIYKHLLRKDVPQGLLK